MKKLQFVRRHWYWLLLASFVFYFVCFDEHSLIRLVKYRRQGAQLEREVAAYRDSASIYERAIHEVEGGDASLERFAREKLMMKRANEDVYLIE